MKFFTSRPVRCACTAAALASALGAMAQEAPRDLERFPEAAARPFSIIDLGAASPNQRPRLALRMRFDSATRAMRDFGIAADDCSSLVRSHTSMTASDPGGSERLTVSVSFALSCRFF